MIPPRFPVSRPRAEHVDAGPADGCRQPPAEVVDPVRFRAAQAEPCLLYGIVRLGDGTEHPVGDGAQAGSILLEPRGQPVKLIHERIPSSGLDTHMSTRGGAV